MGRVLAFNNSSKARGETLLSASATCPDIDTEEIRAKLSLWGAQLSAVIARLEKMLGALNARIDLLPASQSKLDLEKHRNEIVIEIYMARRLLAEV